PKAQQTTVQAIWLGGLRASQRLPDRRILGDLCRFVREQRIDLIHSHNPTAHLYGTLAARRTGRPHVQTVHGRGPARPTWKRSWLRRALTRFTDHIVAVSDDVEKKLVA